MTVAPLLVAEGLTKRYGGIVAADGIDVRVARGRVTGVIGPNGAGKSTLIGLLGGAIPASAGRIVYDGEDITALPAPERARRGIGRTYQIPRPFLAMTVAENLEVAQVARAPFGSARAAAAERADILRRCGLADVMHLPARQLPLLRRKRLEVARALALRPKLLLLDEVGAGLIAREVGELIALIRALDDGERAIVIIEHVIRVVRECCADVVVLNFGRKIAEGGTAEVLASDEVAAVYLGTAAAGRTHAALPAAEGGGGATAPPLLELRGIHAGYGQARVLDGLDLSVAAGQVVAVLGSNGAGKTTLANVISGALVPNAGSVTFAGRDLTGRPAHVAAGAGIAHCMEGRRIFPSLSVEENLLLAARGVGRAEQRARRERVYGLFPVLAERRGAGGTSLSGGQQQMLAIGRALMAAPRLVIFDEISLGLAPVLMDRLYEALARLKAEGLTMLVVEQDVDRALDLADMAHVLDRGRITLSGPAPAVRADARLRQVYFGMAA
jgi:branched-chain amino acid transport system ATP-binding protein